MIEHVCCEHAKEWFDDAEKAWKVIAELERRGLVVANAVRGTQRYINGQKHHGQQVNVARSAELVTVTNVAGSAVVASGLGLGAAPEERRLSKPEVAGQIASRPLQPQGQRIPLAATTHATEDSGGEVTAPPASEASGPVHAGGQPGHRRPAVSDVPRDDPAPRSRSGVGA